MSLLARYSRSSMTRYMLAKLEERQQQDYVGSKDHWYNIDLCNLQRPLQNKFVQSHLDEETETFLLSCIEKSGWVFTQLFHSLVKLFLGFMVSATTINGLLDRGKMFVYSHEQFRNLTQIDESCTNKSMLDLGAGDGMVTKIAAPYFRNVYVTECSSTMQTRLKEKGFIVVDVNEWTNQKYDFISVLNLLDRVHDPAQLLSNIQASLNPDGTVLLAIVLPYSPWVEEGSTFLVPEEKLPIYGDTVETQITSLVLDVLEPAGFHVKAFTKLPYLCEGDLYSDYFLLYDFVFILKPKSPRSGQN